MTAKQTPAEPSPTRDYKSIVMRCLRLRCPACGDGKIFEGFFKMKTACDACGYGMEREPGFYLGSIYVNYGLTAVILVAVCSPIVLWTNTPYSILTPGALLFCVLFPMWFHRYARSFWLGFDYRWDGFRTARVRQEPQGESPVGETPAADPQPNSAAATCPFCHHRRAFGPEEAGKWKDCPKCGNSMLLAVGGPPPAG